MAPERSEPATGALGHPHRSYLTPERSWSITKHSYVTQIDPGGPGHRMCKISRFSNLSKKDGSIYIYPILFISVYSILFLRLILFSRPRATSPPAIRDAEVKINFGCPYAPGLDAEYTYHWLAANSRTIGIGSRKY